MDTGPHIGRPTDNLQGLSRAHLDPANAQLVGIGMGFALLDETHHHAGGLGGEVLEAIELEAGHREAFAQLGGREITGHKLPQPLERDPHRLKGEVGGS